MSNALLYNRRVFTKRHFSHHIFAFCTPQQWDKFCAALTNFVSLGQFLSVYLVFGNIVTILRQIIDAFRPICIIVKKAQAE